MTQEVGGRLICVREDRCVAEAPAELARVMTASAGRKATLVKAGVSVFPEAAAPAAVALPVI